MDKIGEVSKNFNDVIIDTIKKPCPKCGMIITVLQEVLPIKVKIWVLPVVTIKFTIQETYHPDCGFAKFEILELSELQKKLKNWQAVKDFLEYTVQKWMDILIKEETKNKRIREELKKVASKGN